MMRNIDGGPLFKANLSDGTPFHIFVTAPFGAVAFRQVPMRKNSLYAAQIERLVFARARAQTLANG